MKFATGTTHLSNLQEIRTLIAEAQQFMGTDYPVTVAFNGRFAQRMGDAFWETNQIRLSLPLWPFASQEERRQVVLHELAHIIASRRIGMCAGHGPIWKRVMREMGISPDRCHRVVNPNRPRRRHRGYSVFTCGCREHILGPQRSKKAIQGSARYVCKFCRMPLRYLRAR